MSIHLLQFQLSGRSGLIFQSPLTSNGTRESSPESSSPCHEEAARDMLEEWPFGSVHLSQRKAPLLSCIGLFPSKLLFQTLPRTPILPAKTRTGDRFDSLPGFFPALKTPEEAQEAPEIFSKSTRKENKTPFLTEKSYRRLA